jgi:hypothetical protein
MLQEFVSCLALLAPAELDAMSTADRVRTVAVTCREHYLQRLQAGEVLRLTAEP